MTRNTALRVAELPHNASTPFDLRPEPAAMRALAERLGLVDLRKLTFAGEIRASGRRDWELRARLGATVVQPCVVTLEPVTTRIETPVTRRFLAEMPQPEGAEVEMPEDDTIEPLGPEIDPAQVMEEALALALPLYPRKPGVELGEAVYAAPGVAPLRDEDARPFAALAQLRDALKNKD